jgi:hypothetical protein
VRRANNEPYCAGKRNLHPRHKHVEHGLLANGNELDIGHDTYDLKERREAE